MRKILLVIMLTFLSFPIVSYGLATNSSSYTIIRIYLLANDKCKECDEITEWLDDYKKEDYRISWEYVKDKNIIKEFKNTLNIKKNKLPLIVIGSNYFEGFDKKVKEDLTEAIKEYEKVEDYCDLGTKIQNKEDTKDCLKQNEGIYKQKENNSILTKVIIGGIVVLIIGVLGFFIGKKKIFNRLQK